MNSPKKFITDKYKSEESSDDCDVDAEIGQEQLNDQSLKKIFDKRKQSEEVWKSVQGLS